MNKAQPIPSHVVAPKPLVFSLDFMHSLAMKHALKASALLKEESQRKLAEAQSYEQRAAQEILEGAGVYGQAIGVKYGKGGKPEAIHYLPSEVPMETPPAGSLGPS